MSSLAKLPNFVVIGTDTNIGKTVVSFLFMKVLFDRGYTPFYLKPYQTGCKDIYDEDCDAKFIYENIPQLKGKDWDESVSYCLEEPKAPYFASINENAVIGEEKVFNTIAAKGEIHNPVVVEMSGGIMVPIIKNRLNLDLLKKMDAVPILAARGGLGTINHTLMTLELLKQSGIHNVEVLFIDRKGEETCPNMLVENMKAVEMFTGKKVEGLIEPISDFSNVDSKQVQSIERILDRHAMRA